ncbi:pilus assembly protein [Desulforhopalus singaporensis]|uniref:Type IV pilus assembly protein PilY1 n=1 Tax=Desulforhopalus singaporensis TaxID=91360 RepID=A0A1H0QRD9_9BACT|nr:hypothetical protein [Desulforhopalus singaporensis]SDP19276.1 type IV pilus assembly protein PilY1 [Desulforhopalus singaporensis]
MKSKKYIYKYLAVAVALGSTLLCFTPSLFGYNILTKGTATPPFLTLDDEKPNLLVMIDNSGSMLDLAYKDDPNKCTDNTFDPTKHYAGLFDTGWVVTAENDPTTDTDDQYGYAPKKWYRWDSTNNYFVEVPFTLIDNNLDGQWNPADTFVDANNNGSWDSDPATNIEEILITDFNQNGEWDGAETFDLQDTDNNGVWDNITNSLSSSNNLYISYSDETHTEANVVVNFTTDSSGAFTGVTDFVATGEFLNWLSASKFDIQKEVLTGGKYDSETELLISEGRGCAAKPFVKETGTTGPAGNKVITFSIRGFDATETIDNLTRIAIIGVSDGGYIGSTNNVGCELALAEYSSESARLGQLQQYIADCLYYDGTNNVLAESNSAYNQGVQECWFISKHPELFPNQWLDLGQVSEVENSCYNIYQNGVFPAGISPYDSGYLCYGVQADNVSEPTVPYQGYVGRCWFPGNISGGCSRTACPEDPYDYSINHEICLNDGYLYECNYNYEEKPNGEINCKNGPNKSAWEPVLTPLIAGTDCSGVTFDSPGWLPDPPEDKQECIQHALWDYCNDLEVAEVIDTSDLALGTEEPERTWGIVGALTDASIYSFFGNDEPLFTMKVNISTTSPPKGLLDSEAAKDLRIGAMAFIDNGSETECGLDDGSNTIVKYCPDTNGDGTYIVTNIEDGGNIDHINSLKNAINLTEANAWTPLAEGVYNALGYFAQDSSRWISSPNNPWEPLSEEQKAHFLDPCRDKYLLLITEGASTADISPTVATFINSLDAADNDGDTDQQCSGDLQGSTYLDDLTFYGNQKQNIFTYIVTTGTLRDDLTGSECNPYTIMNEAANNGGTSLIAGENPEDLETNLYRIFNELRQRSSSGAAASVVSSSRSGEGAVYQAIFWPELTKTQAIDNTETRYTVEWAGDVRALFINDDGFLFEDSDNNRVLDEETDKRVILYFDTETGETKACYNTSIYDTGICDESTSLDNVQFLWSAGEWLADEYFDYGSSEPEFQKNNRSDHISSEIRRQIFTWNDVDDDGIVDSSEFIPFTANSLLSLANNVDSSRSSLYTDFDVEYRTINGTRQERTADEKESKLADIVNWIRGIDRLNPLDMDGNVTMVDEPSLRSRQIPNKNGALVTWKMGDVINSTPMAVTAPAEAYNLLYNDKSYAKFLAKYKNRRHMVYFGANDGMFHAANGGFWIDKDKKFCLTEPENRICDESDPSSSFPQLGAEMWAYVPYNLLPHLQSLTSPDYEHKYFVDLRPRIFDAQIFSAEAACASDPTSDTYKDYCIHPEGWGTIIVGGMRLGGYPINASDIDGSNVNDLRQFTSSYFVFDITNPEQQPVLLGEVTRHRDDEPFKDENGNGIWDSGEPFTWDASWNSERTITSPDYKHVDLGYSTTISTMIIMKESEATSGTTTNSWHLVIGSGPHGAEAMRGVSDQEPKLVVIPLNTFDTVSTNALTSMRIPALSPADAESQLSYSGGTFTLPNSYGGGFVSDPITVDMDINPSRVDYMSDVVYFGTVEGSFSSDYSFWDGGGSLYRLVTRNPDYGSTYRYHKYLVDQTVTTPADWQIKPMISLNRPISAAASVGFDGKNFWVYTGTGRFWDNFDKPDDSQQAFLGMKEPMKPDSIDNRLFELTFGEIPAPDFDNDFSIPASSSIFPDATAETGQKGLLRVDQILVQENRANPYAASLSCVDGTTDCLPSGYEIDTLGELIEYIAGKSGTAPYSNSADGWYKEFTPAENRERNLGQATLLGGLTTFTTYQTSIDPCEGEGSSYLYGVYYQTGTAWGERIFGDTGVDEYGIVQDKLSLGEGLAKTPNLFVSSGKDGEVKAYIQTSTGKITGIDLENLPTASYYTGRTKWIQCINQ